MRKPAWMRVKINDTAKFNRVNRILETSGLNTVCVEANCPNRLDCFSRKTATFMILGRTCTRNCRFCNVTPGHPDQVDPDEPFKVARAISTLGLKHAVITSVTRDDLSDGGAEHFARVVKAIRALNPETTIEVLIPDFQGNPSAIQTLVATKPDIVNHNVETVPRLYKAVRPQADYRQSLEVLKKVKDMDPDILTKSGIMLGLGETLEEVTQVLDDLLAHHCEILTIGQYLQPSDSHYEMAAYIEPEVFEELKAVGESKGFLYVASAPMVRSSYNAQEALEFSQSKENLR
ncbi:MAG: lipoyl synthase [delta proteobacterium ML8_F1]|nr:MAG: lipoyl synthase [delta proteobacterium ML8_F1]